MSDSAPSAAQLQNAVRVLKINLRSLNDDLRGPSDGPSFDRDRDIVFRDIVVKAISGYEGHEGGDDSVARQAFHNYLLAFRRSLADDLAVRRDWMPLGYLAASVEDFRSCAAAAYGKSLAIEALDAAINTISG